MCVNGALTSRWCGAGEMFYEPLSTCLAEEVVPECKTVPEPEPPADDDGCVANEKIPIGDCQEQFIQCFKVRMHT